MNILPEKLIKLDDNLKPVGQLTRLDPEGVVGGKKLQEHHYDSLIIENSETIAEALRNADLIGKDSELIFLGRQVLKIDVLFAEVAAEDQTFRRFVVFEDKLFRNPEAKREILGQILDYAQIIQDADTDLLLPQLDKAHSGWLAEENETLVTQALQSGDFLLVICGDRIQARLGVYAEYLKKMFGPMVAVDIALMSLAIFSDGAQHILVPHVLALYTSEQGTTIKVVVENADGQPIGKRAPKIIEETTAKKRRGEALETEALMEEIKKATGVDGDKAASVAKLLFDYAKEHGAEVLPTASGASVRVKDKNSNKRSTLFVVTKLGTFYVGWLDRWVTVAHVSPEIPNSYRQRLTEIFGRSPEAWAQSGGRGVIPLLDVERKLEEFLNEVGRAIKALRHES